MLQRLETLERKMNEKSEQKEKMQTTKTTECVTGDLQQGQQALQENYNTGRIEKASPEALLNEVLSEVFS